jgi:hypothetical protein
MNHSLDIFDLLFKFLFPSIFQEIIVVQFLYVRGSIQKKNRSLYVHVCKCMRVSKDEQ